MNRGRGNFRPLVNRQLHPHGQLHKKWGPDKEDLFEAEDRLKTLQPMPAIIDAEVASFANRYITKSAKRSAVVDDTTISGRDAVGRAMVGYQAKKRLKTAINNHTLATNDQFAKDFMMFLLGKHPKQEIYWKDGKWRKDPSYIKDKLRELGMNPDHDGFQDAGIKQYISSFIKKKSDFMQKYTALRMGPNKAFPWQLKHYWLFYKYIVRGVPFIEDVVLAEFSQFFPDNSPRDQKKMANVHWSEWYDEYDFQEPDGDDNSKPGGGGSSGAPLSQPPKPPAGQPPADIDMQDTVYEGRPEGGQPIWGDDEAQGPIHFQSTVLSPSMRSRVLADFLTETALKNNLKGKSLADVFDDEDIARALQEDEKVIWQSFKDRLKTSTASTSGYLSELGAFLDKLSKRTAPASTTNVVDLTETLTDEQRSLQLNQNRQTATIKEVTAAINKTAQTQAEHAKVAIQLQTIGIERMETMMEAVKVSEDITDMPYYLGLQSMANNTQESSSAFLTFFKDTISEDMRAMDTRLVTMSNEFGKAMQSLSANFAREVSELEATKALDAAMQDGLTRGFDQQTIEALKLKKAEQVSQLKAEGKTFRQMVKTAGKYTKERDEIMGKMQSAGLNAISAYQQSLDGFAISDNEDSVLQQSLQKAIAAGERVNKLATSAIIIDSYSAKDFEDGLRIRQTLEDALDKLDIDDQVIKNKLISVVNKGIENNQPPEFFKSHFSTVAGLIKAYADNYQMLALGEHVQNLRTLQHKYVIKQEFEEESTGTLFILIIFIIVYVLTFYFFTSKRRNS